MPDVVSGPRVGILSLGTLAGLGRAFFWVSAPFAIVDIRLALRETVLLCFFTSHRLLVYFWTPSYSHHLAV